MYKEHKTKLIRTINGNSLAHDKRDLTILPLSFYNAQYNKKNCCMKNEFIWRNVVSVMSCRQKWNILYKKV